MQRLRARLRWLERHETTIAIILLAIAMAGSVILVFILWDRAGDLISEYAPSDPSSPGAIEALGAYSAAGDYYNLIFGGSVAMLSGIVGGAAILVLTYFGTKAARRQGDVQLLEFVDERTRSIAEVQAKLLEGIRNLNGKSNAALEGIHEYRDDLINKLGEDEDRNLDEIIETEPEFEDLKRVTAEYIKAATDLSEVTQKAGSDRYSEAFAEQRAASNASNNNPFHFIKSALPKYSATEVPRIFNTASQNVSEILEQIRRLSDLTTPKEMVLAWEACPDTFRTLHFAGAVLLHHKIELMDVEDARNGDVIDVSVNFGGALLLWAIHLLHVTNDDIIRLYQKIFAGRADTLTHYLSAIPLYPREDQAWMQGLFKNHSSFNELIVVYVMRDGVPASEPYDPSRHANIDTQLANALAKK